MLQMDFLLQLLLLLLGLCGNLDHIVQLVLLD